MKTNSYYASDAAGEKIKSINKSFEDSTEAGIQKFTLIELLVNKT